MYGTAGKNAGDSSAFSLASQLVANATSRWWEKPKEDEPLSVWQVCHDKDGVEYYYNVETRETTWDKPAELMTAAEMDNQGDWVWIPDEQECFVPARVISTTSTHVNVMDQNGRENSLKVKKNTLEPLKRSSLQRVVSDLVLLDIMSAPLILHNLKQRFLKHEIYTNVGTILIAINPYTMLPLYTDEVVRQYARRKLGQEMPPHAFNIAHDSFIGLRDFNQNQSIVISGESGAGKTEATKHCLSYLAFMAGSGSNVAASILRTNPILEAFGNAKTLRNDNSSRFGKFMQLFFQGKHCTMSGCMVKSYLLEKIRVVQQTQQERNFHIFYQLTKGATDEQRSKYRLRDPSLYKYLKTCTSVSTIDDVREFKEVVEAFDELKIGKTEQDNIFSIVSAVASLGDVEFQLDRAKDAAFVSDTGSESPTAIAASLLNIDTNTLAKALVTKELRIRNQPTTVMVLNKQQALAQRDALAKFIYGYLFEWLVSRLNVAVGQPADRSRFIGCLDIFGFEIFEINSFEQLCINFTNEMLQQHFNYQTFKLEEAVYRAENIKFDHIAFIDNQPMLDLIAKKPIGLLPVLDEELIVPKGSDLGFLGKMHNHHENSTVFRNDSKRKNSFIIKHYAGDVSYNVVGFLEKNRDSLTEDMIDVLRTSSHDLVTVLFPRDKEISNQEKKASLGSQFRRQLDELMTTLRLTEPHYIRCIKPNPHKAATAFYPSMCNEQLTYSGVFEAVAIRKAGYPFRLKHEVFSERYRVLFDNERAPGSSSREQCLNIIKHMKLPMENVQMGTTMVLYRADEHKLLELHRSIKVRLAETQADLERLVTTDTSGFSDADKEIFFRELAGAVRSADEFRIKTPASQQARRLIDKYVEERMDPETKTQLEVALKSKNLQQLTAILKICEANGYQTSIVRQCQELLEQVIDAEAALRVAKSELSEDYLQKAIAMCEEFSYDSESVQEARLLLENISRAKEMIRRSMSSRNHEHLRRTIDFCRSFGYETAAVLECEELFDQIMHVRKLCSDATKAVDLGKLKTALREADALEYDVDIVYEARLLYDRLLRIDAEAGKALASVHDLHVRAVLKAANEVGFKTKNTKRLRQILDGRQSDYVQAQLSSASAIGDHGRAILISLSLREERQAEHSHSLQIAKYPKLKDPQTWGEEKFWGSSTYRAQTMLSYNDAYVHAPLTSIFTQLSHPRGKELTEKVLLIYENVQKIMTIRYSQRIPQRTQEVLMYGLENVELRDEVYLAMIKMITNNPNPQSIVLGWDLFGLVVLAFPPSVDFEDYVFSFLALPSNEQSVIERNLKYLLTRSCYLGAVAQPYWRCQDDLQNMRHIFNLHAPRQSNNGLSKTDVTPYEDLKSNYYDEDYEDHVFTAMKLAKIAQRKLDLYFSQSKLFWEREMNNRKRAHNDRTAGIAASTFPAVTAAPGQPEGPSGPQPPQFPLLNSADLFDEQDEEEEHRANRKAAKKGGKKGKNSKDKSPAAARSPPRRGRSSSFASERDDEEISISSKQSAGRRGKNKNRDDEDEYDEIEEEKTVSTKSKKKKGGKKSFVNEEEDDDIMPSFTSPASKTKGTKKTSKKSFVDDSDDDMPAAKPTKKKSAKKSILDDSDDDMPAVTKKSTKKKRTAA